jgi:DNA-binding NarL/FixJ family response regulator
MTHTPSDPGPQAAPTGASCSSDTKLTSALDTTRADADLDAATRAASALDVYGLGKLRAWIDARLGALVPDERLSEREVEAVRLIAWGYSNKQIAARLKVSVKTIETYKTRAMEKLGIRSRVGLVRFALSRGWLGADDTEHNTESA